MATGIFSRNFLESLYQGPASPKPVLQRKLFLKHRRDNLVMCGLADFLAIVDDRVKTAVTELLWSSKPKIFVI